MSEQAKALEITHDEANQVFLAMVDGHRCVVDYQLRGNTMVITHTGVPPAVGGRGIAAALTRFAVLAAQAKGWKVEPACSYADTWFKRNTEYASLLA